MTDETTPRRRAPRRPRRTHMAPSDIASPTLRRIASAAELFKTRSDQLDGVVAEARAAGDTWAMVGTALGISRQAAYQRFGKSEQ